jgi:hypothetical protein
MNEKAKKKAIAASMRFAKAMGYERFRLTDTWAVVGFKPWETQERPWEGMMFLVNYRIIEI